MSVPSALSCQRQSPNQWPLRRVSRDLRNESVFRDDPVGRSVDPWSTKVLRLTMGPMWERSGKAGSVFKAPDEIQMFTAHLA